MLFQMLLHNRNKHEMFMSEEKPKGICLTVESALMVSSNNMSRTVVSLHHKLDES